MSLSSARHRPSALAAATIAALVSTALSAGVIAPAAAATSPAASFTGYTDKSDLRLDGRQIVQSKELPVIDGEAPASSGTTYFVDSTAGDDAGAGTSEAVAWRTLARVNATVFQPGDRILLKAGSVWAAAGDAVAKEAYDYTNWISGQPTDIPGTEATALLAPKGSGASGNPIILSSYGTGAAPELNGRGVVNDVLQLTNQQHWDVSNLEISNVTDGFNPTTFEPGANQGLKPGEENPKTGDLRGIHVQAENAGTLRGFEIHNVFVHDVSGVMWSISSTGLDRSKRTGGILFEGLKGDAQTVSQFEDIAVRDSFIANTSFSNVGIKQFSGMGENRYQNVAPGWGDRAVAKASSTGVITEDPNWRPHTNVEISGNYLTNRNTAYGWDSLYLTSVQRATVEGNLIDGTGVSGIEMYYSDNVVVQNNEVAEVELRANAADSNGIDPDRGTSNILIQGNYVHDSGEGILLCGFSFSTAIVRYNVIQDVDKNYINPHGDSGVNVIYNNLMYNTQKPSKNNTVGFFESSGSASDFLVSKNPHYVFNNVFVNVRSDVSGAAFRTEFPGVQFSNNSYFGPKVTAPAADAHATVTDPLLFGNPAVDIANAAISSGSSPLIAAGRTVDLSQIAPGFAVTGSAAESRLPLTGDFFGSSLTTPPTVGPSSYRPADGLGLATGLIVDDEGASVPGATVSYGSATATADARGRYSIETASGDYTLTPSAHGYADGAPVTVTLGAGATLSKDLVLGATTATDGTIVGTVRSSGSPLAGVTVTVSQDGATVATATTSSTGAFAVSAVPIGEGYTVSADMEGFEPASRSDVEVKGARTTTVDLILAAIRGETHYVINETFDDESAGAFTATADGALVAKTSNAAVASATVVEDEARAGNKYLRLAKSTATSATLAVHNAVEQNLTGTVTIEARLQRTSTNGTPNQFALYSFTEKDWNATNPTASVNPSATIGFAGGKIITHNVTGASTVKNVADYAVGRWYTVRNVVDLAHGTFDFYIDDMATPVLADQPLRTVVDDLDYFNFFINGSNVGNLLIDYVRVNTGMPYDFNDASLATVGAESAEGTVALTATDDGLTFAGSVTPFTETATITAAPGSPFAKIAINGTEVTAGGSVTIELQSGAADDSEFVTDVPVVVTAEDGTKRTYTVSISRTNPNQSTALRSLSVEGYELAPVFDPQRRGEESPYVIAEEVSPLVASVKIRWEAGWTGQQIQVNGELTAVGATEATVQLADGENVIQVTADSFPGDFGTYVIKVTRANPQPTITGTPKVGSALTAVPGSWSPHVQFSYEWKHDGATISGATSETYTPVMSDIGTQITVVVTGSEAGYTSLSKESQATATVAPAEPWELRGFIAPVDVGGVWNTVKGGSTVPFKFQLFEGAAELTTTSAIKGFTAVTVSCPSASAPTDAIELVTNGATGLTYVDGQFLQKWQTPKAPGQCVKVTVTAKDNSKLVANFIIK